MSLPSFYKKEVIAISNLFGRKNYRYWNERGVRFSEFTTYALMQACCRFGATEPKEQKETTSRRVIRHLLTTEIKDWMSISTKKQREQARETQNQLDSLAESRKRKCGIYFLLQGEKVVYVGQSTNIHNRIITHSRNGKQFDSFRYVLCQRENLNNTEAKYILMHTPPLNKALPPNSISKKVKNPINFLGRTYELIEARGTGSSASDII